MQGVTSAGNGIAAQPVAGTAGTAGTAITAMTAITAPRSTCATLCMLTARTTSILPAPFRAANAGTSNCSDFLLLLP